MNDEPQVQRARQIVTLVEEIENLSTQFQAKKAELEKLLATPETPAEAAVFKVGQMVQIHGYLFTVYRVYRLDGEWRYESSYGNTYAHRGGKLKRINLIDADL